MNGFMVLARFAMDDVPLRLFDTHREAEEWVKETNNIHDIRKVAMMTASKLMNLDSSVLFGVDIVKFENGCPTECIHLADYEEDICMLEFCE